MRIRRRPLQRFRTISWTSLCARILHKARARNQQRVGRLKRFKRVALRCETARNFRSVVSFAAGLCLIKFVHTAYIDLHEIRRPDALAYQVDEKAYGLLQPRGGPKRRGLRRRSRGAVPEAEV